MSLKQVLSSFLILIASLLSAQSIQSTFELAEVNYANKDFKLAKSLYKRVQFFDSTYSYTEVFDRLSSIYLEEENELAAIEELIKYRNFLSVGSENWFANNFKLINIQLALDKPKEAISELLQMKNIALDSLNKKKVTLYLSVAYFQDEDFENSELNFKKLIQEEDYDELSLLFKKNNKLERRYGLIKLQLMSSILPGSGQVFSGFYKDGINSLVLVGGFVYLFVHTNKVYGLIEAILGVYPWVSRYHLGGIYKVRTLSITRINIKRDSYYHSILNLVK